MNNEVKKQLRAAYRAKRAQLSAEEKCMSDSKITRELLSSALYAEAEEILCYVSTDDEVDTRAIISDALTRGKSVFVPKCTEQRGVMLFYKIASLDDLKIDSYGILEPINPTPRSEWRQTGISSLCIVPALCCDRSGNRLGYGGGYDDRFLSRFNGKTVCLCYARFSDADLPVDDHDIPCDAVISG